MGYLFFYIERFLWILWILCEIYSLLAMIIFFTQRPQRAQRFIHFPISRLRWSGRKLRHDKSAQRVLSTPSPLRGTPACLRGRNGPLPASATRGQAGGRVRFILQKTFTSLSACYRAGKSSYRQGSVLAWSQSWTWMSRRMTICQHCQDKTTAMMDVLNVLVLLRFYFYNTLIINSVCLCLSVSVLLL